MRSIYKRRGSLLDLVLLILASPLVPRPAFAGPQFSRQYNTSCGTCHTVYPKLNDLGKAFQDAGFQFPEQDEILIGTPRALLPLSAPVPRAQDISKQMFGVVAASQIAEPEAHALEEKYLESLKAIARQLKSHGFPSRFCLGPAVLDEAGQQCPDQHGIRFGRLDGKNVVEITGVYYASYSLKQMDATERSQRTFRDVILPILQVMVPQVRDKPEIQGYVIEVSQHIRGKVFGVSLEASENLAIVLPSTAATRLIGSRDIREQQTLLREGEVFLNAEPINLDVSVIPARQ